MRYPRQFGPSDHFFDAACTRNHSSVPLHLPLDLDLLELFRCCLCLEILHPRVVLVRNAPSLRTQSRA